MTQLRLNPGATALSAFLVLLLGLSSSSGQDAKQQKKAYTKSPEMVQGLVLLKAFELMPKGKGDEDFGRTADVRVTDQLMVTGVPAEFIEKSTEAALVQVSALGLFPELKDGAALEKALKEKTLNSRAAAKALVAWWTVEILAEWKIDAKKRPSTQEMLQLDAKRTQTLKSLGSSPEGTLAATWLLFPQGLDTFSPNKQARKPVSFQMLVERFDPDLAVTHKNAEAVAEELIWTQRIRLSDGTAAKLPDARRVIQALLLEQLGFEIGDPMDADNTKREAARKKLAEARRASAEAWKAKPK
jgi:hypothetical protein